MASLATFLLGSAEKKHVAVDKGLDAIFHSAAGTSNSVAEASLSTQPKASTSSDAAKGEKRKQSMKDEADLREHKKARKHKDQTSSKANKHSKPTDSTVPKPSTRQQNISQSDSDEEENGEARGEHPVPMQERPARREANEEVASSSDSDDEGDPSTLVHESLLKGKQHKDNGSTSKRKYVPPEETPERRNARTIFVGNVPVEVAKSRPLQKRFKRHFTSLVPSAKIESVRFRSVAFAAPTAKLPSGEDDTSKGKGKGKSPAATDEKDKEGRQHDRDRAASWRAKKGEEEEEPDKKQFLSPKEKKRIAFIKHELHSGVDAVNAYIVFAHPIPDTKARPANVPPPAPSMDPYEAARLAAERCDGTVFMERTIRVDLVGKDDGGVQRAGVPAGDPKLTIFVGNLDFASKEEDLRAFFEALVVKERGAPGAAGEESSEDEEESAEEDEVAEGGPVVPKPRTWVKRVRIVRDKDTQLGKGFAYVQFVDRQCVDEILALEESQLKFAKRKLRVQRCKTVPGGAKVTPKFTKPSPSASASAKAPAPRRHSTSARPSATSAPKGNPALGSRISHLPKDERKRAKAADPERVARRMAKKQAKLLAEKGVKSKPRVERERARKRPGEKKAVGKQGEKKKGRVRSGNALAKMNTKK